LGGEVLGTLITSTQSGAPGGDPIPDGKGLGNDEKVEGMAQDGNKSRNPVKGNWNKGTDDGRRMIGGEGDKAQWPGGWGGSDPEGWD
jgi:hypothetical protein